MKLNILHKKNLVSCFLIINSFCIKAQGSPPPPAAPTEKNAILITEIIKVTHYEYYFQSTCSTAVIKSAVENAWSKEKLNEVLKSIKFKYFESTIYNLFAKNSTEELKEIIKLYKKLNKKGSFYALLITNEMVENNLNLFKKSLVEGKYVTTQ
jgi:dGTP triphosphohydrolase